MFHWLIGAMLALNAQAGGAPPTMPSLAVLTARDGTRYLFEIAPERAEHLPRWDPQTAADPPLPLGAARRAAEAWVKARNPQVERFELNYAMLQRAFPGPASRACEVSGCWH